MSLSHWRVENGTRCAVSLAIPVPFQPLATAHSRRLPTLFIGFVGFGNGILRLLFGILHNLYWFSRTGAPSHSCYSCSLACAQTLLQIEAPGFAGENFGLPDNTHNLVLSEGRLRADPNQRKVPARAVPLTDGPTSTSSEGALPFFRRRGVRPMAADSVRAPSARLACLVAYPVGTVRGTDRAGHWARLCLLT